MSPQDSPLQLLLSPLRIRCTRKCSAVCVLLYKKKCKTPRDPSVNYLWDIRSNGNQEKIDASHGETESVANPGMATGRWPYRHCQRKGEMCIWEVGEGSRVSVNHANSLHFWRPAFGEIAIKLLGAFLSVKLAGQIPAHWLSFEVCIFFLHRGKIRRVVLCL